jgi:penicillin-binding protein 1A
MASGGRKGARREPNFDAGPDSAPAVRVEKRAASGKARRKKSGRKTKSFRFRPGRVAYWGCVLGLWGVIACLGLVFWVGAHLPPIQSLEIPKRPPSIKILDINQRLLLVRGDMGGVPLTLKELPPYVPNAFIAIEDRRFYSHFGIDPLGIARAAVANVLRRGVSQGGSTLTQQLAKNLFLTQERTVHRKAQEAALAIWLERKFSKAQILELYLNRVYFGAGAWGIEQAAQRYFGKTAKHLSLSEAAMLAGLVKSPSRLAPTHNYEAAMKREGVVLAAMVDAGFESEGSMQLALAQRPRVTTTANASSANYAADWILDALNDLIGNIEDDIVVQTTIDPVLQASAEKSLVDELAAKGEKMAVSQGALVSMTPEGAVRAMVGGRNYADSQFNRAVTAKRQPGSAFKPFVYLTALERGLTPDTLREDRPVKIKGWSPENYTREYFGQVTLTKALAMSLNTVSVRLTQEFGPTAVVRTAHRLGISSKLEPNASISLGTSEVSVLELVSAYAPFANGGLAVTPYVVERVTDPKGKVLYARDPQGLGRIIEPAYVAMMNTMLQETLKTGTGHNAVIPGWPAGGKTGTSQDFRDAWFIGYTSKLVTGVWLGNDDGTPTKKVTGGGLPVDVWTRFMRPPHQGVPVASLPGKTAPTNGVDDWLLDRLFSRR